MAGWTYNLVNLPKNRKPKWNCTFSNGAFCDMWIFSSIFFKVKEKRLIITRKLPRVTLAEVDTKRPKREAHSGKQGNYRSRQKPLWNYFLKPFWDVFKGLFSPKEERGVCCYRPSLRGGRGVNSMRLSYLMIFNKQTKEPSLKQEAWAGVTLSCPLSNITTSQQDTVACSSECLTRQTPAVHGITVILPQERQQRCRSCCDWAIRPALLMPKATLANVWPPQAASVHGQWQLQFQKMLIKIF